MDESFDCWIHLHVPFILSRVRLQKSCCADELPESKPWLFTSFYNFMFNWNHPITPVLIGFSPTLVATPHDWPTDSQEAITFTGFWTVSKAQQEVCAREKDPHFGGDCFEVLERFLA